MGCEVEDCILCRLVAYPKRAGGLTADEMMEDWID